MKFYKYEGTGNDFVMIDNRHLQLPAQQTELYRQWCDRRFGIGADGLIMLQNHPEADFDMRYYNADGNLGSMCGNGGRCAVAFAYELGMIRNPQNSRFLAVDGWHNAQLNVEQQQVQLHMTDVTAIEVLQPNISFVLNTGSPHYVCVVPHLAAINVSEQGRAIRYSERFAQQGINVNFVEIKPLGDGFAIATYERGVEAETYSCGTGTVAAAIVVAYLQQQQQPAAVQLHAATKGGDLWVSLQLGAADAPHVATNICLVGSARKVFEGELHPPQR